METAQGQRRRTAPGKEQIDTFLKNFEWTWTTAVLASMAILVYILVFVVIVPSFWMYWAEQDFTFFGTSWGGASAGLNVWGPDGWDHHNTALLIRDAVAMGLTTVAFALPLVVGSILQNYRRRLRGRSDKRPVGGYK